MKELPPYFHGKVSHEGCTGLSPAAFTWHSELMSSFFLDYPKIFYVDLGYLRLHFLLIHGFLRLNHTKALVMFPSEASPSHDAIKGSSVPQRLLRATTSHSSLALSHCTLRSAFALNMYLPCLAPWRCRHGKDLLPLAGYPPQRCLAFRRSPHRLTAWYAAGCNFIYILPYPHEKVNSFFKK